MLYNCVSPVTVHLRQQLQDKFLLLSGEIYYFKEISQNTKRESISEKCLCWIVSFLLTCKYFNPRWKMVYPHGVFPPSYVNLLSFIVLWKMNEVPEGLPPKAAVSGEVGGFKKVLSQRTNGSQEVNTSLLSPTFAHIYASRQARSRCLYYFQSYASVFPFFFFFFTAILITSARDDRSLETIIIYDLGFFFFIENIVRFSWIEKFLRGLFLHKEIK